MLVQRLPENTIGRDFVVGDIHGSYDQVWEAMKTVKFDGSRDRLFSVGDTVDRGPGSERALKFLALPYVYACQGNHEGMFLELYENGLPHPAAVEYVTCRNGMNWWQSISDELRASFIDAFRKMPVAIEIETPRGTVGMVHAEVPEGMTWQTFLEAVEQNDKAVIHQALWGRSRIRQRSETVGVPGVGRVFHGHTPLGTPKRLGNVYYIDTGCVFGVLKDNPAEGRMTFADVTFPTVILAAPSRMDSLVDVRFDNAPTSTPFGNYASAI